MSWLDDATRQKEQQRLTEEKRQRQETERLQRLHEQKLPLLKARLRQLLLPHLRSIQAYQLLLDFYRKYQYGQVEDNELRLHYPDDEIWRWVETTDPYPKGEAWLFAQWIDENFSPATPRTPGDRYSGSSAHLRRNVWRIGVKLYSPSQPPYITAFFEKERYSGAPYGNPPPSLVMEEQLTTITVGSFIARLKVEMVDLGQL